jgi:hypothetical protein
VKWCALDVMGVCPAEISCDGCVLWEECGGRAKGWRGFLKAEDVLAQRRRSSKLAFESEMLCVRPSRADNVFPMFSLERHVVEVEPGRELVWVGGIDFGMRNVTVVLFAQLVPTAGGTVRVEVVDEYVQDNRTTEENLKAAAARGWPRLAWIGADPAGNSRSSQTGQSEITVARKLGWKVRDARSRIGVGVEIIRRRLENGRGDDGLVIHPRCGRLIQSLVEYHYDIERPSDENPVKDGKSDHAVDALRYLLVNLESGKSGKAVVGRY